MNKIKNKYNLTQTEINVVVNDGDGNCFLEY